MTSSLMFIRRPFCARGKTGSLGRLRKLGECGKAENWNSKTRLLASNITSYPVTTMSRSLRTSTVNLDRALNATFGRIQCVSIAAPEAEYTVARDRRGNAPDRRQSGVIGIKTGAMPRQDRMPFLTARNEHKALGLKIAVHSLAHVARPAYLRQLPGPCAS